MSSPATGPGRVRAYLQFLAAVCYFFLARSLAERGAQGLVRPPLVAAGRAGHAVLPAADRLWGDGLVDGPPERADQRAGIAAAGGLVGRDRTGAFCRMGDWGHLRASAGDFRRNCDCSGAATVGLGMASGRRGVLCFDG